MAFTPKNWKDRAVQFPGRRLLAPTDNQNVYTVSRQEGVIQEEGDIFNAASMNDLESRIYVAFTKIDDTKMVVTGDAAITATTVQGTVVQITEANLDTGNFEVGKDYYVLLNADGSYTMSLDKNSSNYVLLGGFHYGVCRRRSTNFQPINSAGVERGTGWESNVYDGIIPDSMWTLSNRPKCAPEGMVRLPNGIWVDIYLSSANSSGLLTSVHNATPLTGTEGYSWYSFTELASVSNKRMLTYNEWCILAIGSPAGSNDDNTNAWSSSANTARQLTGYVRNAVSVFGCVDCAGNVWEWTRDLIHTPMGDTIGQYDVFPDYGKAWLYNSTGLCALSVGGNWRSGIISGARAVAANSSPWLSAETIGIRCACEELQCKE